MKIDRIETNPEDLEDEWRYHQADLGLDGRWWTRDEMRHYFSCVHKALGKEGLFYLDAYGGWDSQETGEERRKIPEGFTYVWDQNKFDPIGHEVLNHIHFEFRDGTKLERAFTYHWRFWTLPELTELLAEAGFSNTHVYWEDEDEEGEGTGVYRARKKADNAGAWVAYLIAEK